MKNCRVLCKHILTGSKPHDVEYVTQPMLPTEISTMADCLSLETEPEHARVPSTHTLLTCPEEGRPVGLNSDHQAALLMKSISHFCHLFAPTPPPPEAGGRFVWLTLYYPHPAHLVRTVTSSSSQSSILPGAPLFFLHLYRLPPGCPSTCPVSLCSSDWTRLPPSRVVIDGGVIVFLSVTLKAPSWSGLLYHLRNAERLCARFPFITCANLKLGLCIDFPCLSNQKYDWFSHRSLKKFKTILTSRLEPFCHFE